MGLIAHSTVIPSIIALVAMMSSSFAMGDVAFNEGLESFSNNMLQQVMLQKGDSNIFYSPLAIHACLTMARMGAEGETAKEMDTALGFKQPQSTQDLAENYHALLSKYDSSILHLANKLYVMKGNHLDENFRDLLVSKFMSRPEEMNFVKPYRSSRLINQWIANATDNGIKHIISSSALSRDTSLVAVSAIHFHAQWKHPFQRRYTISGDFITSENKLAYVKTMYKPFTDHNKIPYGEQEQFKYASIPYENCDLSMWIFVPNERTGLNAMLQILRNTTMDKLAKDMSLQEVFVKLPKFTAEVEIDLSEPLQMLGMGRLFEAGNLSKMLKTPRYMKISKIVHKAVIDVHEMSPEGKGNADYGFLSPNEQQRISATHPFYYVIANADNVILFQGTVVKLS